MMMTYNKTSNEGAMETVYTYEEWLKEYKRNEAKERKQKQEIAIQKCLGLGLLTIGIFGCAVMPKDAGGFLFASILGIIRVIC